MSRKRSIREAPACAFCGSHLVHPTAECEIQSALWEVELRCPDCERLRVLYCTQAELEHLDRQLDRVTSEMMDELGRLEALHMEEWVARFAHALDADLVGPDDF
jgi:ribosomal protein S27E